MIAPGDDFDVGSMSRISHKQMVGYRRLPDWTDDPTDSSLRESEVGHMIDLHIVD